MASAEDEIRWSQFVFSYLYFLYDSTKPYVVGNQQNRLSEMIHFSSHNLGFECQIKRLECKIFPLFELCQWHIYLLNKNELRW